MESSLNLRFISCSPLTAGPSCAATRAQTWRGRGHSHKAHAQAVTSLHSFRSQVILTLSHANKRGSMKTRVPARQLVTGLGTSGWVCHPRGAPKGISLGSKAQVPESDFLPASTSVSNPGYIHGPQLPFPFSR